MTPVVWTRAALRDLDEIQDYIARDSPSAAHKLVSKVIERTDRLLGGNPLSGRRGRVSGTRELALSGTPLIVIYREWDGVEVLAVVHGAQDWPERFTLN